MAEHYAIDHRMSTASWGTWISAHSETEEEAFATFFSLFEQYQALSGLTWPDVKISRAMRLSEQRAAFRLISEMATSLSLRTTRHLARCRSSYSR